MANGQKERIGPVTAGLMLGLAALIDALQFLVSLILTVMTAAASLIPGVNLLAPAMSVATSGAGFIIAWMLAIVGFILLSFWFSALHVPILIKNDALGGFLSLLGFAVSELTPLVNALPALSLWVWRTVREARKEDRERQAVVPISVGRGRPMPFPRAANENSSIPNSKAA